jgi:hypothetical protein
MQTIQPEFDKNANPVMVDPDHVSESDSDADGIGDLTLEMTDSPFRALMNKINKLIDTGLKEDAIKAFELTRSAISDGIFKGQMEDILNSKLADIIDLVHSDRQLCAAFSKSIFDVEPLGPVIGEHAPSHDCPFKLAA